MYNISLISHNYTVNSKYITNFFICLIKQFIIIGNYIYLHPPTRSRGINLSSVPCFRKTLPEKIKIVD